MAKVITKSYPMATGEEVFDADWKEILASQLVGKEIVEDFSLINVSISPHADSELVYVVWYVEEKEVLKAGKVISAEIISRSGN